MSISRASRWHFIVSANQKASLKSARLCTHVNADWLVQQQFPLVAKSNKRLDCC